MHLGLLIVFLYIFRYFWTDILGSRSSDQWHCYIQGEAESSIAGYVERLRRSFLCSSYHLVCIYGML